jgi:transketolase C-terminal domain/subunit
VLCTSLEEHSVINGLAEKSLNGFSMAYCNPMLRKSLVQGYISMVGGKKIRKVEGEDVAEKIFGGKTDALEGCSHHSNENMGGLPLSGLPNFGTSNKTKVKSEVSLR